MRTLFCHDKNINIFGNKYSHKGGINKNMKRLK